MYLENFKKLEKILMRSRMRIKSWLGLEQMYQWLQQADDESSRTRRLALWLICTGELGVPAVSVALGVSKQAIWLWIRQYNDHGPAGIERAGRGGRRWGFMTIDSEAQLLKPFVAKVKSRQSPKAAAIKQSVEKKIGREVSMSYVYRLLARHDWSGIIARSRPAKPKTTTPDTFQKLTKPWKRG